MIKEYINDNAIFIAVPRELAKRGFEECPDKPDELCLCCILCSDFKVCKRDYEVENDEQNTDRFSD